MQTSESECIEALREAADRLGESLTKAAYENLGLRPVSGTIMRVMGGWNAAKRAADLEAYDRTEFGGTPVAPEPDDVDLPPGTDWEDLSGYQPWYRKNREREIARKEERRSELRRWLQSYKAEHCACERCGESDPACLDFHQAGEKDRGVAEMVSYGYGRDRILTEIQQCEVLCANCHRKEHRQT